LISLVLAGGKGTRLWPESLGERPKQLCDFFGRGSLLSMSLHRLKTFGPAVIVCGRDQEKLIRNDIREPEVKVLCEPMGRNTAPAVGLFLAAGGYPEDEVIGVFPADHYIEDTHAFRRVVGQASGLAREGFLVTIGIIPEHPETGYGYIERGPGLKENAYRVKAFREKPDADTASRYVSSGSYYWNAGVFIATAATWLRLFKKHLLLLHNHIVLGQEAYTKAYRKFPGISLDYGIAEKADEIAVVEGNFGWSDVGSWDALAAILPQDERGNALTGEVLAVDSVNCIGRSQGRKIVMFGVDNLVVVESGNHVLVCPRQKSQEIKKLLELLETG
jgi:mannose-1-phosphate guanylyltransferase